MFSCAEPNILEKSKGCNVAVSEVVKLDESKCIIDEYKPIDGDDVDCRALKKSAHASCVAKKDKFCFWQWPGHLMLIPSSTLSLFLHC